MAKNYEMQKRQNFLPSAFAETLEKDRAAVLNELANLAFDRVESLLRERDSLVQKFLKVKETYYALNDFEFTHSETLKKIYPTYKKKFLYEPLREVFSEIFSIQASLRLAENLRPSKEISWNRTSKIDKKHLAWLLKIPQKRILQCFSDLCKVKYIHHDGRECYSITSHEVLSEIQDKITPDPLSDEMLNEISNFVKSIVT